MKNCPTCKQPMPGSGSMAHPGVPKGMPADAADISLLPDRQPAKLHELERQAIDRALAAAGGNVSAAARQLGISRNTIYRRRDDTAL